MPKLPLAYYLTGPIFVLASYSGNKTFMNNTQLTVYRSELTLSKASKAFFSMSGRLPSASNTGYWKVEIENTTLKA